MPRGFVAASATTKAMITVNIDNTIAKRTKMLFIENLKPQPTRQHDSSKPWFDAAWAGFGRQGMQPLASTRCSHKIEVSLPGQVSTVLQKDSHASCLRWLSTVCVAYGQPPPQSQCIDKARPCH
jgi:hypothetical protein